LMDKVYMHPHFWGFLWCCIVTDVAKTSYTDKNPTMFWRMDISAFKRKAGRKNLLWWDLQKHVFSVTGDISCTQPITVGSPYPLYNTVGFFSLRWWTMSKIPVTSITHSQSIQHPVSYAV
jgi:hypothetical protein